MAKRKSRYTKPIALNITNIESLFKEIASTYGGIVLKEVKVDSRSKEELELFTSTELCKSRRYMFDYVIMPHKIAIEIDGGLNCKGGHSTATGILRDMHKGNLAQMLGYKFIRFSYYDEFNYLKEVLTQCLKRDL